jgi:hypothetical protein
MPAI